MDEWTSKLECAVCLVPFTLVELDAEQIDQLTGSSCGDGTTCKVEGGAVPLT